MCWSYEVSIAAFIIGFTVGLSLVNRNKNYDKVIGYLILFYSFVQLWEAQLWKAVQNNDVESNLRYTRLIYLTLWIQALAIGIGVYQHSKDAAPMTIGALLFLYGLTATVDIQPSKPDSSGHLDWGFSTNFYYLVSAVIASCFILYTDIKKTWIALVFLFLPYVYLKYNSSATSVASLWCWFCAAFSFIPLVFY